jgi:hypothetical protein
VSCSEAPVQKCHISQQQAQEKAESIVGLLGFPESNIVSCTLRDGSEDYFEKLWEIQKESGITIKVGSKSGKILFLSRSLMKKEDTKGKTKVDAVSEQKALQNALSIVDKLNPEFSIDKNSDNATVQYVDIADIADDDLYGAFWVVTIPKQYEGYQCLGAQYRLHLSALAGKIGTYVNFPLSSWNNIMIDKKVDRNQAISIAKELAGKNSKGEVEECHGAKEMIIDPKNKAWERTDFTFMRANPFLCWVVGFKRKRGSRQTSPVTVYIDAKTGTNIGIIE